MSMNFPTLIIGNKIIGCFPTQRSSLNMFDVALGDTTQESIRVYKNAPVRPGMGKASHLF